MTKQLSEKQKALIKEAIAEVQQCRVIVSEMTQMVNQMLSTTS
ncbi:MAG TPA: hypothetical protein V6D33_05825 [Cyanophyceae cyanobacterium]